MSDGMFPDEAKIWIVNAGVTGASIDSSSEITGEISNFSESGGEKDTEPIAVFGGGNIDKESPRSQIEVSFDIEMQYEPPYGSVAKWDEFKYGTGLTSATEGDDKTIYIQWVSGTTYYSRAYNNAKAVTFNPSSAADDNLKGSVTFKLSPTNSAGVANLKIVEAAASTVTWS